MYKRIQLLCTNRKTCNRFTRVNFLMAVIDYATLYEINDTFRCERPDLYVDSVTEGPHRV
jgi:hypothetical protein